MQTFAHTTREEDLQYNASTVEKAFHHTWHSNQRADQRGISDQAIQLVIDFGEVFHKQGFRFFAVKARNLPDSLDIKLKEMTKNLIICVSSEESIITCYRRRDPLKYLRKKSCIYY